MKYVFYAITIFLGLLILPIANAEEKSFTGYMRDFKVQYKKSDKVEFDKIHEQEILQHIENHYLKPQPDLVKEKIHIKSEYVDFYRNALDTVFTLPIAKLLLSYGGYPFGKKYNAEDSNTILIDLISDNGLDFGISLNESTESESLPVQDILNDLTVKKPWDYNIPSKTKIEIMKLYIALGAGGRFNETTTLYIANREDIKLNKFIYVSLLKFYYGKSLEDSVESGLYSENILSLNHRADDIVPVYRREREYIYFYRSPVTYWLEEFIEKDFPVSMVDTHPLLYSRYVRNASKKTVADMLNNPEEYKIPVNINCPYRGAEIETGFETDPDIEATCPLTPSMNMRDAMGRTPLHIAKERKNHAVYDYLILRGADTTIQDFRGNLPTPIDKTVNVNDAQTRNRHKNMQRYFSAINDIEFSPSVSAQLTDIENIIIKITIHEQKPSDEELAKLTVLYQELQQHDAKHALPRLTQYYIRNYQKLK